MVNELGITREDIEEWTKQSVAETIEKVLKGIKIENLARDVVLSRFDYFYKKSSISDAVERIVREKLDFDIKLKEESNASKTN
jgi:hypothetical protein